MTKNANAKQATPESSNLPLFFKEPVPLNMERHAEAGILPSEDFSFAADTNSIIINAVEFFEAVKHYPIVFTQSATIMPTVVVGLEQKNDFVGKYGKWQEGKYIPAYVRKYPFVFMDMPDSNQLMLCIDESSKAFKADGGEGTLPLYKDGAASDLSKSALDFCSAFHGHNDITRRFCEDVQEAGILMPSQTDAKTSAGKEIKLQGFQMIDEKKFNELPQETIMDFFKKGWLPFIYASLISSSNWRNLLERVNK